MENLQPHRQRVVTEKEELDSKIEKLNAFTKAEFFKTVDAAEQGRLRVQLAIMDSYSHILGERIAQFSK